MPNYIYNTIVIKDITEAQKEKLEQIKNDNGIASHYLPIPKDLNINSPQYSESEKLKAKENIKNYGHPDWYSWCKANWGTKWGDCDFKFEDNVITYSTAWSPLSDDIIDLMLKDFPNMEYTWEEEQGFGEQFIFEEGEVVESEEWDTPPFENEEELNGYFITFLNKDFKKSGEIYKKGWYDSYNLDEYLGETIEEVTEKLKP